MNLPYNAARLEAEESRLDADWAALNGKQKLLEDYDEEARRKFGHLVSVSPVEIPAGVPLAAVCEQLRALATPADRLIGDFRPNEGDPYFRARDALAAAERARVARDRATALRAEVSADSEALAPRARLVKACRDWAGLNGYQLVATA